MSCCCGAKDDYTDVKTRATEEKSEPPAPSSLVMDRGASGRDSDKRAVEVWRARVDEKQTTQSRGDRSLSPIPLKRVKGSDKPQHLQLSPNASLAWRQANDTDDHSEPLQVRESDWRNMATIQSVEVDDLSSAPSTTDVRNTIVASDEDSTMQDPAILNSRPGPDGGDGKPERVIELKSHLPRIEEVTSSPLVSALPPSIVTGEPSEPPISTPLSNVQEALATPNARLDPVEVDELDAIMMELETKQTEINSRANTPTNSNRSPSRSPSSKLSNNNSRELDRNSPTTKSSNQARSPTRQKSGTGSPEQKAAFFAENTQPATESRQKSLSYVELNMVTPGSRTPESASPRRGGDERSAMTSSMNPLSDLPSDIDSVVRERYLLACRLLKSTLVERENHLMPREKEFLLSLVEEADVDPSEDIVSAIETASETLISDPLFQVDSVHSAAFRGKSSEELKEAWHQRRGEDVTGAESVKSRQSEKTARIRNRLFETVPEEEPQGAMDYTQFNTDDYPFLILGLGILKPKVLTPPLMEALRGFFPFAIAEENMWLKFSLDRDGPSLPVLLSKVRTSRYTVLSVETTDGHVFGAFCSTPWRVRPEWYGSDECFLWCLKQSRCDHGNDGKRDYRFDNQVEVYPFTGHDEMVQYCSPKTLAVGGGDWSNRNASPHPGEPVGIGFMVDGDLMGGETNSCATFANPRLCNRKTKTNEFDILALEMWTVTPCIAVEDAEHFEMHQLFVDESSTKYK